MYILKNAFKNLSRNKGRNGLIAVIIFTIILSTTVSIVINTTTNEIISDYKNRFGAKVTISPDMDKVMEFAAKGKQVPAITTDNYMDFSKSEYLQSAQMNYEYGGELSGHKAIDEDTQGDGSSGLQPTDPSANDKQPTVKLLAATDPQKFTEFSDGQRKIVEGNMFKNKNECIVSKDFAKLNKLKVGDQLKILSGKNKKVKLTVAGIYEDITKAYSMPMKIPYLNRRNEILTSIDTIRANFPKSSISVTAAYELKSPDMLEQFDKELRAKGLDDVYKVSADETSYNKIVGPVLGLSKISMTFMWVVLILGGIILLVLTTIAIRERKYEIGVLRAMGLKKMKLAIMLAAEILMITAVSLGMGLGLGSAASQPIADMMIDNQVKTVQQNAKKQESQFELNIEGQQKDVEPLDTIKVALTPNASMQIILVAVSLAILSSMAGVVVITKYEPMKILSERN